MYTATVIIFIIEHFFNTYTMQPKVLDHIFVMLLFKITVTWHNMSHMILAHPSTVLVFNLLVEYGWFLYTLDFKHPQRRKSKGVRSGNLADYLVCLTTTYQSVLSNHK